ncbi:PREDICTED: sucrase-isomaltase, intestinal-like [Priapulus caudatus]|uniref:Sucrase-isomaltase, intestinal-like n=1 Tax=Priapulus caudatus TaxID=37621 RepID=A0ABM1F656_PRICU|nr:PREDICTED: sucrase-isomaltase, intestinal-like [Priapulus caudatus]
MRFIIILDPAIISNVSAYEPYNSGIAEDVFVKWAEGRSPDRDEYNNDNMLGYVWPTGKTVFPDFFLERTQQWWKDLIVKERQKLNFDAIWIDMNEPACFGTNDERPWNWPEGELPYWTLKCYEDNKYDSPPYKTNSLHIEGTSV